MKVLRGLLIFIISFMLTTLIIGLTVTTAVKDVIQNQLMGEMVKQAIIKESDSDKDVDLAIVDKIFSYEETNDIINSAITDYTDYLSGKSNGVSEKTVDLIINFCVDHKDDLESITGEEIDISKIQDSETREKLIESVNDAIKKVKIEKNSPVVTVISTYGKVTSENFKLIVLVAIGVLIVLIGLVSWSLYKWMKSVGATLITSGVVVSLLYLFVQALSSFVNKTANMSISIDGNSILILGIIELISGIVLIIIYSIINKIVNKKKEKNVFEQESDEDYQEANSNQEITYDENSSEQEQDNTNNEQLDDEQAENDEYLEVL